MSNEKRAGIMNASERDNVNYRKAKLWEIIFGMASSGMTTGFYLLVGYSSMIATQGFGVAIVTAGLIISLSSFIDATTDALVAALFEMFHPKKGKIRLFLIFGWLLCALASLTLFQWASGHFSGVSGIVLFAILYNVFRLGYTILGTAGGTIGIVLTNDPTQRPMLGVVGTIISYTLPILYMNVITFVILPKHGNQYNAAMLAEMVWWYLGITLVFLLLTVIGIHRVDVQETFETISREGKKDEKIKLKDMLAVLKENKNVQMYMLAGISDKLAQNISAQSVITTLFGGVLIGSYAATTMVGNISSIVAIVFAICGGTFIAKWGAKKTTTVWSAICIGISILHVLFCFGLCGFGTGSLDGMEKLGVMGVPLMVLVVLSLLKTGANMILSTAGTAMRADVTDYEYERSGKYMPAVVSGVYSFIDKIVNSFSSTIAAFCIALIGYTSTIPQMGDERTWPLFWMAMFLNFGLPVLGWICNLIAMKFYNLDMNRMVEVQRSIAERKKIVESTENEN